MYGIEPDTGTGIVLDRLARPYDPQRAVAALLGLSTRVTRQMIGAVLASSAEAEDLLDAMPRIVRSLAIATTDQPERCYGELRGPVLWSETMSARSASAGDPGLFVCATTSKAYDTDENRVLKSALHAVYGAGQAAEHTYEPVVADVVKRARHNGQSAARLMEHQTLAAVPVGRITGRALRRTRAGSRRATYRPALDLLRRAAEPVDAEHLLAFADPRTRAQHDLLAATLHRLEDVTGTSAILRVARGSLLAGPLAYHHPGRGGDEGAIDGITINGVLLDVADPLGGDPTEARARLEARAGAGPAILALGAGDVERAVALALTPS